MIESELVNVGEFRLLIVGTGQSPLIAVLTTMYAFFIVFVPSCLVSLPSFGI